MDNINQELVEEQKATNNFLIMGIVLAFILLIVGLFIYLYVTNLEVNESNNITETEQRNTTETENTVSFPVYL